MPHFLAIFLGGGLGCLARYGVGVSVQYLAGAPSPLGTLFVNVVGCFLMGLLAAFTPNLEQPAEMKARLVLGVGVLGGFTTFSAFGLESFTLLEQRQFAAALANVLANVLLGIAAVWAGLALGRVLNG